MTRHLLTALCLCGHPRDAHLHYRPGTDCGLCLDCSAYVPALTAAVRDVWRLWKRSARA